MPPRFQLLEKVAFSFVVLSALLCSTFIAYQNSSDVRVGVHVGKELFLKSGQYSYACATVVSDPCAQVPLE